MGFFRDTIRDARRQVRSGNPFIQRSSEAPIHDVAGPALPEAPQIEKQTDGAQTINRFQKEGPLVPREVPNRVETGPEHRRRVDPSSTVGRSSASDGRSTQSIDKAILLDDTSVTASSWKNGLATGKGDTAHAMRQDPTVNEASSIGLHGMQQQVSDDLSSVESPPGQYDPVAPYSSDNLQRETGERKLSRDAGLGTPSESFTLRWSAEEEGRSAAASHGQLSPHAEQPASRLSQPIRPDLPELPADGQAADRTVEVVGPVTPIIETPEKPTPYQEHIAEPFTATPPGMSNKVERREQTEPKVIIGQVDVMVVSDPPTHKTPASDRSDGMASRRYWRRL